ncbi:hypothetical protein D9M68_858470 [compost metagenome]
MHALGQTFEVWGHSAYECLTGLSCHLARPAVELATLGYTSIEFAEDYFGQPPVAALHR